MRENFISNFSEDEFSVAKILLELPSLISSSSLKNFIFSLTWGTKRRRSPLNVRARIVKPKSKALSPSTPLSFSPSESDEKSKRYHKKQFKSKDELLETIQQLSQQKSELQREVGKVMNYNDKLKAVNRMLKAKRIELRGKSENHNVEMSQSLEVSIEGVRPAVGLPASVNQDDGQLRITRAVAMTMPPQTSSVVDRTANQHFESPSGPLGARNEFSLPDLNVALDESCSGVVDSRNNGALMMQMQMQQQQQQQQHQQQDMMNKALAAAQARQKRLQIQRLKHSVSAAKRPISL